MLPTSHWICMEVARASENITSVHSHRSTDHHKDQDPFFSFEAKTTRFTKKSAADVQRSANLVFEAQEVRSWKHACHGLWPGSSHVKNFETWWKMVQHQTESNNTFCRSNESSEMQCTKTKPKCFHCQLELPEQGLRLLSDHLQVTHGFPATVQHKGPTKHHPVARFCQIVRCSTSWWLTVTCCSAGNTCQISVKFQDPRLTPAPRWLKHRNRIAWRGAADPPSNGSLNALNVGRIQTTFKFKITLEQLLIFQRWLISRRSHGPCALEILTSNPFKPSRLAKSQGICPRQGLTKMLLAAVRHSAVDQGWEHSETRLWNSVDQLKSVTRLVPSTHAFWKHHQLGRKPEPRAHWPASIFPGKSDFNMDGKCWNKQQANHWYKQLQVQKEQANPQSWTSSEFCSFGQLLAVGSTILGLHPRQVGAEDVGFGRWTPACSAKQRNNTFQNIEVQEKMQLFQNCFKPKTL